MAHRAAGGLDLLLCPLTGGRDACRRPHVPRVVGVHHRRRVRAEHDDPQRLRAEHGLRDGTRAGEARARDPRGEHGRRQEALAPILRTRRSRQDRPRRGDPYGRRGSARVAYDRRRPAGAVVGGDARRGRVRNAVGRVHAGVRDRRNLRGDGPGPGDGRDELDGARHGASRRTAASTAPYACPASRWGPSAAGRSSRMPGRGSSCSTAPA